MEASITQIQAITQIVINNADMNPDLDVKSNVVETASDDNLTLSADQIGRIVGKVCLECKGMIFSLNSHNAIWPDALNKKPFTSNAEERRFNRLKGIVK